jgi:tRNA 2-selenouridine synthase
MTSHPLFININNLHHHKIDAIIDTRSPAEYLDDHLPGAINCPVLTDDERHQVGMLYKQVSPFEARKVGAALVARNIAHAIEQNFSDHPKSWQPLIYCWRGGQRSGAMQIILREIGWDALRLEGGYKAYRNHVLQQLETLPGKFRYIVIAGPTGSGKTRLLAALAQQGAQTLDLEELAGHKGSVLGRTPQTNQPSRRSFDTRLIRCLSSFDHHRPIFTEAESKRIGDIHLPTDLMNGMHQAPCICIAPTIEARLEFLLHDYAYFITDPAALSTRLEGLKILHSKETMTSWQAMIAAKNWPELVLDLLNQHYDPHYQRSMNRSFDGMNAPLMTLTPEKLNDLSFTTMAQEILQKLPT